MVGLDGATSAPGQVGYLKEMHMYGAKRYICMELTQPVAVFSESQSYLVQLFSKLLGLSETPSRAPQAHCK